jgi:hypothetical protein
MLCPSYTIPDEQAIAPWVERLFEAARKRRLELGAGCGEPEASRREVAAAAVALLAATAIVAAEECAR